MANKTQLQTNNANLDALITRVNAAKDVAASLPEAGGGSIESCHGTISAALAIPSLDEIKLIYIDSSLRYKEIKFDDSYMSFELDAAKNTVLILCNTSYGVLPPQDYQNCTLVTDKYDVNGFICVYKIDNDSFSILF